MVVHLNRLPCLIKTFIYLILILFTITSCSKSEKATPSNEGVHLKQSNAYLSQGQYGAAIIEARNAIQKDPHNPEGHILLARIFNELGSSRRAIALLEKLTVTDNVEYWFTLIEAYGNRGKSKSAMTALDNNKALLEMADPVRFHLRRSRLLAAQNELDSAAQSYQHVLSLSENNIDAQLGLAEVYAALNKFHDAYDILAKLENTSPDSADVVLFKAKLALNDGDLDKGEELLTKALSLLPNTDRITPTRASIIGALSDILTKQGRSSEALIYTRLLAESLPGATESQTKYQDAINLYKKGQYEESEQLLKEVLTDAPGHEMAGQLLGIINYIQGDLTEAERYFNENLDPEISNDITKRIFAMTSMKLNKPKEVLDLLEGDIDTTEDTNLLGLYGLAALSDGDSEKGIQILNKVLTLDPSKSRIHLALANHYNTRQNPDKEKALEHILTAYKDNKSDHHTQRALVTQYLILNRQDDAQKTIENVLTNYSQEHTSFLLAGDFAQFTDNITDAKKHYQKAQSLAPKVPSPIYALGKVYFRMQNFDEATSAFRSLVGLIPDNLRAYQGLLTSANKAGRLTSVVSFISTENDKRDPQLTTPYVAISQYYSSQGQFEEALKYESKAREIAPDEPRIHQLTAANRYARAVVQKREKHYEQARASVIDGLKYAPNNMLFLTLLAKIEILSVNYEEASHLIGQISEKDKQAGHHLNGDLYSAQNKHQKALVAYTSAWEARQHDLVAAKRFDTHNVLKDSTGARLFINEWVEKLPNSARARTTLASLHINDNKLKQAERELEAANQLAPNSPMILNNLAWVYQQLKNDKAEATAKKAYELASNNASIVDTYGWILHENGKRKRAKELLQRAHTLDPNNAEIEKHLKIANTEN